MKSGYLLLSQMRSGTTWLCSLTNSTNVMGKAKEQLIGARAFKSADDHFHHVIEASSTENGAFGLKIFPDQLNQVWQVHGYDFIRRCRDEYNVGIVVLDRSDVLRHAVSIVKYLQARSLSKEARRKHLPFYDFQQLCSAVETIEHNRAFWRSYLTMSGIPYQHFTYEELLGDPAPYLSQIEAMLGVQARSEFTTNRTIKRDQTTEEWVAQFQLDTDAGQAFPHLFRPGGVPRTVDNFVRFLRGDALA